MKSIRRYVLFLSTFLFLPVLVQADLDSLWGIWNDQDRPDTVRLKALNDIIWDEYLFSDQDSAFYYAQVMFKTARLSDDQKRMANALYLKGVARYYQSEYDSAMHYYVECIRIRERIGIESGVARALNGMGLVNWKRGNHAQAINDYIKGLKILERLEDKRGMVGVLNNIGIIYNIQGDNEKAMEYYERGLALNEELGNKESMSNSLNNIGILYKDQGLYDDALENYSRSVALCEEIGNMNGLSNSLENIGIVYMEMDDLDRAMEFFTRGYNIRKELDDRHGITMSLSNISTVHERRGEYVEAVRTGKEALEVAEEIGAKEQISAAANCLYQAYKALSRDREALEMHELFISTRDSLKSEEVKKEVISQAFKYEYNKQALADSLDFAKKETVNKLQLEKSENLKYSFLAVAVLSLVMFGFIFYGYKQKLRVNKYLKERNKFEIENKKRALNLFGQQVSPEVAKMLLSDSFNSGSNKVRACIMFLDIRDFTPFSEGREPSEIIQYQNDVFGFMIDIISEHKGIVNQFMGDGFLAMFGAPVSSGNDSQNAVDASLEILKELDRRCTSGELIQTRVGIGLHTGDIVTGNVGTEERKQYSITGNTVILASRIEQLNKEFKSELLISKEVYDDLEHSYPNSKSLGPVQLKGRSEPTEIIRLV